MGDDHIARHDIRQVGDLEGALYVPGLMRCRVECCCHEAELRLITRNGRLPLATRA